MGLDSNSPRNQNPNRASLKKSRGPGPEGRWRSWLHAGPPKRPILLPKERAVIVEPSSARPVRARLADTVPPAWVPRSCAPCSSSWYFLDVVATLTQQAASRAALAAWPQPRRESPRHIPGNSRQILTAEVAASCSPILFCGPSSFFESFGISSAT